MPFTSKTKRRWIKFSQFRYARHCFFLCYVPVFHNYRNSVSFHTSLREGIIILVSLFSLILSESSPNGYSYLIFIFTLYCRNNTLHQLLSALHVLELQKNTAFFPYTHNKRQKHVWSLSANKLRQRDNECILGKPTTPDLLSNKRKYFKIYRHESLDKKLCWQIRNSEIPHDL